MRGQPSLALEMARLQTPPYVSEEGAMHGLFEIRCPSRYRLLIISSGVKHGNSGVVSWEHVSASIRGKHFCPSWEEMCFVKDLFWGEEETIIQFHPPKTEYVNTHGFTLHLWKPPYDVSTPPSIEVGLKGVDGLDTKYK